MIILFATILLPLVYIGVLVFLAVMGRPIRFTILEHQRGVLYRRGLPVKDLGSGRHWVWPKREKIVWMDTRPIQVAFQDQAALCSDGASAVFGVLGSAQITEMRKAIYSSRNCYEVPAFVLHCCTRSVLNAVSSTEALENKERLAEQILNRARPRLSANGFEVLAFRLTQISVPAMPKAE